MSEPEFAWRELKADAAAWMRSGDEVDPLREDTFRTFQVQVKSDADIGKEMHKDPVTVLRREIPEMEIPEDVRAMVLRVNAEVPANPKHGSYVFVGYPGSMTLIGLHFKYENDDS
jgi:hypothetical protein